MSEPTRISHRHSADCGCTKPLTYDPPDLGPLVVMRQPLDQIIVDALDAVPAEILPELQLEGTVVTLRPRLAAELVTCGFGPAWLAEWLLENVLFQVRIYAELTKHSNIRIRLERVADDGCMRFHADDVTSRLVCTYRGPGTEWIDPKTASVGDGAIDARNIRRAERGAILLMRGLKAETLDRPALLHRSPRVEGTDTTRLLLVIDDSLATNYFR